MYSFSSDRQTAFVINSFSLKLQSLCDISEFAIVRFDVFKQCFCVKAASERVDMFSVLETSALPQDLVAFYLSLPA